MPTVAAVMPKKPKRDDTTCKVETAIVRKARVIAAHLDISLAELFSDILRSPIDAKYTKAVREMNRKEEGE